MSADEPYRPHPSRYDYIDDDTGHAMKEDRIYHPEYGQLTAEVDQTVMYQTARRTTGNLDILLVEAEQAANGGDIKNVAVPTSPETEELARRVLEEEGLTPAWEVADVEA